jgi:hypothetical protein
MNGLGRGLRFLAARDDDVPSMWPHALASPDDTDEPHRT